MKVKNLLEIQNVEQDNTPLFEMANFRPEESGITGFIFISAELGAHDVRVKWYPTPPQSRKDPCLIVTVPREIGGKQKIKNHRLPQHQAESATKDVYVWIDKNREKIIKYWDDVHKWSRAEVREFEDSFEKV